MHVPPLTGAGYANTTFEDGIEVTFAVGNQKASTDHFPIYVGYESKSTGFGNMLLTASVDQGLTWAAPIQVNDNRLTNVDEFQPNLAVAPDGTLAVLDASTSRVLRVDVAARTSRVLATIPNAPW